MRRFLSVTAAMAILAVTMGCTPEGVGDPCKPESCPPKFTDTDPPVLIEGECGWLPEEVYLESFSLQCRSRVCMVFRVGDGVWDPYCTRRCGPGAAIKDCGANYKCAAVVDEDALGEGCYCVHEDQLNLTVSGTDQDMVDACK